MNWGSVSYDQGRNLMVVADMRMPVVTHLTQREQFRKEHADFLSDADGAFSARFGPPYAHSIVIFMSPAGVPCLGPSWGTISAVDLASGELVWQQPAGTGKDPILAGHGLQNPLPLCLGMPALRDAITTT